MPLHWTIDSQRRTVEIVADGNVSLADAMAFFDAIEGAKALPYTKLLDCRRGLSSMTAEELSSIAVRIRGHHDQSVMGAFAVVATDMQAQFLARVLGAAAVADRPIKMFTDIAPARRWRDAQSRRAP
ncbi:MAG: hypothetical protein FJX11_01385 [Alphaproteobacteria bacterium]|nr:hypothetical protein [Alphaproteobacteria bacterium]